MPAAMHAAVITQLAMMKATCAGLAPAFQAGSSSGSLTHATHDVVNPAVTLLFASIDLTYLTTWVCSNSVVW